MTFHLDAIRTAQAGLAEVIAQQLVEEGLNDAQTTWRGLIPPDDWHLSDDLAALPENRSAFREALIATAEPSILSALIAYSTWVGERILSRSGDRSSSAFEPQPLPVPNDKELTELVTRYHSDSPEAVTALVRWLRRYSAQLPPLGEVKSGRLYPDRGSLEAWQAFRRGRDSAPVPGASRRERLAALDAAVAEQRRRRAGGSGS